MRSLGRKMLAAVMVVFVVAACVRTVPSTLPRESSATGSAPPASAGISSPTASDGVAVVIEVDMLRGDPLQPRTQTAVCDLEPSVANDPDAAATTFACGDGLTLGLRALGAAGIGPVERLYLHRPACITSPCSREALNTATVVGWVDGVASAALIDSREATVRVRSPDTTVEWPRPRSIVAPPIQRPAIADAPAEIATRIPFPYCGETEMGSPPDRQDCFRDAVLARRPAELLQRVFSTEGDPITWLVRFDGRGPVIRYALDETTWTRQAGAMILDSSPGSWSFDPWADTSTVLPG